MLALDIAIAGAGPAGLAAALYLKRGGHRAALFSVLQAAVLREQIPIETGFELDAVETGASKATLLATGGRHLGTFHLIVDATGARSKIRRHATASSEPKPLAYGAFWASLAWRGEGFDENALLQRYQRANVMIGVLPIGRPAPGADKMAAFFWSLKPGDAEAVRAVGIDAWKARVEQLWPAAAAYTSQINGFEQLSLARYGHHTIIMPVGRRLAVIGDAAHSTSPQLGQGANMALLDAAALAHAVALNSELDSALSAYARARRMHVRVFQALSWMFTPFYQSDSVSLPFIRDRLVATIARIPPAPQFLASMVAGTVADPFRGAGLKERDWLN